MARIVRALLIVSLGLEFALPQPKATAQSKPQAPEVSSALPDVAGIRPGMPAQEAYNLLKARHPSIKIGVGQLQMQGLGDKPISAQISAQVVDASAPETITVWLTSPPGQQVVFAVGRTLEYDPNQPLLRSKVVDSLRQKFGPETLDGGTQVYWAFDEQGRRPDAARMKQLNCISRGGLGNLIVAPPQGPTFPAVTPIIYSPQALDPCDSFIKVNAELSSPGPDPTYVHRIALIIWDLALERRSQEAYRAYLASAANGRSKEELEKAKQRKLPTF
jgi:hypothetical protein